MRYVTLGRAGLRVSELGLGTANFGTRIPGGADAAGSARIFERFADAGGTFIDTADMYQQGESERILGSLLGADRDHFVLTTKYGYGAGDTPHVSVTGNGRKAMVRSVEESLRRLGTDHIDLLWAHAPDGLTPIDAIVHGFDDLVASGKIGHVGLSNFPAWQSSRAVSLAEHLGWTRLTAIQVEYSLVDRSADREQLPMASALGVGVTAWSPLGGGTLTGKYRRGEPGRLQSWGRVIRPEDSDLRIAVMDAVVAAADDLSTTPEAVAMAWFRSRQRALGTALVPIAGPRTDEQLESYLGSLELDLPAEVSAHLDEVSAPDLGAPHVGNLRQRPALHAGQRVIDPRVPA